VKSYTNTKAPFGRAPKGAPAPAPQESPPKWGGAPRLSGRSPRIRALQSGMEVSEPKKMWLRQAPSGSAGLWAALPLRGGAGGGRGRGRREEAEPARRRRRLGAVRGSGASVAEKEAGGSARRRSQEGEEAAGEEAKVWANG
jgi:hypothetical protein